MPRHKRQEAEVTRVREHILDAAARAFAREGYAGATMGVIAKEAGYTAPTLYAYFKGKAEIWGALVFSVVDAILDVYEAAVPPGLSFPQKVELLLLRQFEVIERHRDAYAFFLLLKPTDDAPAREDERNMQAQEHYDLDHRTKTWMQTAMMDTDMADADPALVAVFYRAVVDSFLVRWAAGGCATPLAELCPPIIKLLFSGMEGAKG